MSITLLGLTFHLYGLIVGIAVGVSLLFIERQAKKYHVSEEFYWRSVWGVLLAGFVGARLYHVFTDWPRFGMEDCQLLGEF
jgi:prolipoprotein diacylglyceryltransferase